MISLDDLAINIIASFCGYNEVPALIALAGKRTTREYYNLFGPIYSQRSFILGGDKQIIFYSHKWKYYYALSKGVLLTSEELISIQKSKKYSYKYAYNILGKRWLDGEWTISSSPKYAYEYAFSVIKNRWDITTEVGRNAERSILTNVSYALEYSRNVLKGRWIEAEAIISSNTVSACDYAINIVGKRWWDFAPAEIAAQAEKSISNCSASAYRYSVYCIKGSWSNDNKIDIDLANAAENVIYNSYIYAIPYSMRVSKVRLPEYIERHLKKYSKYQYDSYAKMFGLNN